MQITRVTVAAIAAVAVLTSGAAAGFVGWVAALRDVGDGRCLVDIFAGFDSVGEHLFPNVGSFDIALRGGASFVQSPAAGTTGWGPAAGTSNDASLDSFVTLGSRDGSDGHAYASQNVSPDPWFSNYGESGAVTVPLNAGWYTDPANPDGGQYSVNLLGSHAAWIGATVQGPHSVAQVWVAHFLVDRAIADGWHLSFTGAANAGAWIVDSRDFGTPPAAPADVRASMAASTTSVTVSWQASPGATGYLVHRDGAAVPIATLGPVTSYEDLGATPGASCSYTVVACTGDARSAPSASVDGYRRLAAPPGVAATDGDRADGVAVSWDPVPGATGYQIFRDGGALPIATTSGATSVLDAGVALNVEHLYSVRATCPVVGARSDPSTADAGHRSVAGPIGVSASDGASTEVVTVSWRPLPGATAYRVYRDGSPVEIRETTATSCTDAAASVGAAHSYRVRASFAGNLSAYSVADNGYRNFVAPTALTATDGTYPDRVILSWTQVDGAAGYRVLRNGALLANCVASAFVDMEARPGVSYTYTVQTRGSLAASLSVPSPSDKGWRGLAAPSTLAAADGTSTAGIMLAWSASQDATGYRIYRDGSLVPLATVGAVTSWTDTRVVPGTAHSYAIRAFVGAVTSPSSPPDGGYRDLLPPVGVQASDGASSEKVTVTWGAVPGATTYQVYRASGGGTPSYVGSSMGTTLDDSSAQPGTVFTYTVRALGLVGMSAPSAGTTGFKRMVPPASVSATAGAFADKVVVTWAPVFGAKGYQVFRSGSGAAIATLGITTTFSDTGCAGGTQFTYTVKALGETVASASVASTATAGWRHRSAPTGVQASDTDPARVCISWTAPLGAPAATGYEIYRSIGGAVAQLVGTTTATVRTFDDTTVATGVVANYTVRAKYTLIGAVPAQTVRTFDSVGDSGVRPAGFAPEGGADGDPAYGIRTTARGAGRGGEVGTAGGSAGFGTDVFGGSAAAADTDFDLAAGAAFRLAAQVDALDARIADDGEHASPADRALVERLRALLEPVEHEGDDADTRAAALPKVIAMAQGDVTLDGAVDGDDLAAFLSAVAGGDAVVADLDRDGAVTDDDLVAVIGRFLEQVDPFRGLFR